jgi:hypothetical protein
MLRAARPARLTVDDHQAVTRAASVLLHQYQNEAQKNHRRKDGDNSDPNERFHGK